MQTKCVPCPFNSDYSSAIKCLPVRKCNNALSGTVHDWENCTRQVVKQACDCFNDRWCHHFEIFFCHQNYQQLISGALSAVTTQQTAYHQRHWTNQREATSVQCLAMVEAIMYHNKGCSKICFIKSTMLCHTKPANAGTIGPAQYGLVTVYISVAPCCEA